MPILDVAIGLSLYYLLLGLICTMVNEMIAGMFDTRSVFLERGILRLLGNDSELKKKLFEHPLIRALSEKDGSLPSYISSGAFATTLLDVLSGAGKAHTDVEAVIEGARANPALQGVIATLADSAKERGVELKTEVAEWFDHGMDRVTGWYKRNAQRNALIVAAVITLVLNANTISIGTILWTNPTVRAAVVDAARVRAEKAAPEELPLVEYKDFSDATASTPTSVGVSAEPLLSNDEQQLMGKLGGWSGDSFENSFTWWWRHLPGWLITILAASLGAPFWFDTLKRFVNIRNAGKVPPKIGDQAARPGQAQS
jgi:hypothetical protein